MSNLVSSAFHRLSKNKIFYFCISATFLICLFVMLNGCRVALLLAAEGYSRSLDDLYFEMIPFIGIVCALFGSLFLGVEYSNGTIRNKIVVGKTRTSIYLSNFTVCLVASELFTLACLVSGLAGIPILGTFKMGAKDVAVYIFLTLLVSAAWTGIFTLVGMLITDRAICAVVSILLFLGILMASSMIYNALCEPEMISGAVMTANGVEMSEPEPNPSYVSGVMRDLCNFIVKVSPSGQGILMANKEMAEPVFCAVSSAVITIVTTVLGIFGFRKKDLK